MNKLFNQRVSKYYTKSSFLMLAFGIIGWFGCRKEVGVFLKRAVDQLDISIEGDFFERTRDLEGNRICTPVNLPFLEETETASGYVARNINETNDVFFLDRALVSTHRATQQGTTWRISELFLVD